MSGTCREQILERKRREYRDLVPEYYDIEAADRSEDDNCALRQVRQHPHTSCHANEPVHPVSWMTQSMYCILVRIERCPTITQVIVDVPRTAPGVPFFSQPRLQKSLERILFLWGIRCVAPDPACSVLLYAEAFWCKTGRILEVNQLSGAIILQLLSFTLGTTTAKSFSVNLQQYACINTPWHEKSKSNGA